MESQFYGDGQHNGGVYNSGNLNPYIYTYNNPIRYIDPNGKQVGAWEIPLAYYVATGIVAAIASYQISQAVSNVKFSTSIERPIFREEVPSTSPKITIEQLFKDKEKSLEVEIFPPAKKDNLIVRTIPQASPQKINILNADYSNDDKKESGKVHGNSLSSQRPTWGYKLYHNDGTFLKNGITSQKVAEKRYTKGFMGDKRMIKDIFPNRRAAYDWEAAENKIQKGPLNKNNH